MGACMSNSGNFEPPGARAVAAFVAERDGILPPASEPAASTRQSEERPVAQPPIPAHASSHGSLDDSEYGNPRHPVNRNLRSTTPAPAFGLEPSLQTPANTVVFKKKKSARKPTAQSRVSLTDDTHTIDDGYADSWLSLNDTNTSSSKAPVYHHSPDQYPRTSPNRPTRSQTVPNSQMRRQLEPVASSTSEKGPIQAQLLAQSQILGQLYDFGVPAPEIALVVKVMRGGGTPEEEALLLQRLYAYSVPSTVIAQVVDAMRASQRADLGATMGANDDKIPSPKDAPPVYDYNGSYILEWP